MVAHLIESSAGIPWALVTAIHEGWWTGLDYARSVALDLFQEFFRRGASSATTRYASADDHPAVLRGLLEIAVGCLSAAQAHPLARRHPD